jgi:hypothetical protein
MNVSMRRLGLVVLTALTVVSPLGAQFRTPIIPAPNPGIGPARLVAGLGNAAVLGNGLVASPFSGLGPLTFGGNFGPLGMVGTPGLGLVGTPGLGFVGSPLGFGALNASFANPALGYGSLLNGAGGFGLTGTLLNSAASGYGYGYGYGMYGTQWMMNPYQGYLQGAADITNANAQYQMTIQQAKLVRQQAVQEAIKTRRAMIEEAEYERAHMPDPEKIRQRALERELDRARVSPPLTEIWSGRSLNALLRNAIAQQGQGSRGPNVPLSEDTLQSINPTAGDTRGNVGLLKDKGKLQWPQPLLGEVFKEPREDLSRHLRQAFNSVQGNNSPDESTLSDLQVDLKRLQAALDANVSALSPDQYNEARRYLRLLGDTITALKDRNVVNVINGAWALKGKNVAELVQHMRDKGLWFAPATPGDESAYTALYYALAAFDAGLPRSSSSESSDTESGSKGRTNSGKEGGKEGGYPGK